MATLKKEFVIRHVMEDVSKMEEEQEFIVEEDHFGIPWCLVVYRKDNQLNIFLNCEKSNSSPWSIDALLEFKLISPNGDSKNTCRRDTFSSDEQGGWGWDEFISWDKLMEHYTVDDKATIEVSAVIEKMKGCGIKRKLRNFENRCSDVRKTMVPPKKEFVMRYAMKDVSKMEEEQEFIVEEEHFEIPWCLYGERNDDQLQIFLYCENPCDSPWSVDTHLEFKLISPDGDSTNTCSKDTFSSSQESAGFGWDDFISWKNLIECYTVDDKATIEVRVVIEKMEGCGKKEKLRRFDESVKECSDVVLVVQERRFYLLKMFLALQSSYFKGLLLGNFEESKKEEVTLNDIDPDDFQNFLELIHGESAVDDSTVDGILCLADMYDAPTALRRCEEFLLKESKRSLKGKLELSLRYKLQTLKSECLFEANTIDKIQSIMPAQILEMDLETSQALLQKTLNLSRTQFS